jgi:glycosyltransferase involved in cell wall biosynthesis
VIRNWTHVTASTADRAATRARLGWGDDEIIALHAGNMGMKQGLENVVDTARLAAGSPVRFVMLGDGGQRRHLESVAADVAQVEFVDPLPGGQFEDALAAADVLLLNEGAGVAEMSVPSKLTSYFAAARPVVGATDARSAASAEITRSNGGVRVDTGDPAALLAAVRRVGQDHARAAEMGRRGRAYAEEFLSASAAARSYDAWVGQLAATRNVRSTAAETQPSRRPS